MIGGYIDVTYLPYMLSSTDPKVFVHQSILNSNAIRACAMIQGVDGP